MEKAFQARSSEMINASVLICSDVPLEAVRNVQKTVSKTRPSSAAAKRPLYPVIRRLQPAIITGPQ